MGDQEYKEVFDGKSPLAASKVAALITAIQQSHPAVIGVDLDTGNDDWSTLMESAKKEPSRKKAPKKSRLAEAGAGLATKKVESPNLDMLANLPHAEDAVWAGVPLNLEDMDKKGVPLQVECPLGGTASQLAAINQIGVAILPEDPDGKVRG